MNTHDLSTPAGRRAALNFYLDELMRSVEAGGKNLTHEQACNSLRTRPECADLILAMDAADTLAQNAPAVVQPQSASGQGKGAASQAEQHDLTTMEGRRRAMDGHLHRLMKPVAEGGHGMSLPSAWKAMEADPEGAKVFQAMKDAGSMGPVA